MKAGMLLALGLGFAPEPLPDAPMLIPRIVSPVSIDGRVDEEAWAAIEPLPLVNLYPAYESPLTEKTEIRIGHDDHFLYASIRAWDSEPRKIRATTLYRDRWESDDEFALILDTFSDGENGAMFVVTPAGVRIDNQLTHDAEPGRGEWMNRDWNVPWDAAAQIVDDGWIAEIRVPFSSLRFASDDGVVRMRLKTYRYLPRKGENQMFPPTRPDAGSAPHFKLSVARDVVMQGVRSSNPIYVQPYVAAAKPSGGGSGSGDVGLDVKFTPTRATAVDVTVNTDFAQVEVDQQRINLTRFPLFFPERRPFFLERAGLFSMNLGGNDKLFHSRRIGLDEGGALLPLQAGVRVSSRVAGWDVGFLDAQVGEGPGRSSENDGVIRIQRHTAKGLTFGAGLVTAARGGGRSSTFATDAAWARGQHKATAVAALSTGEGKALERSRLGLRLNRGSQSGLAYSGEYRFTGREFDPALGFLRLNDAHEFDASVSRSSRYSPPSRIRRMSFRADVQTRYAREFGLVEQTDANAEWNVETSGGHSASIRFGQSDETISRSFSVTPTAQILKGSYRSRTGRVFVGTSADHPLRFFVSHERGGYYGGQRSTWSIEPLFIPGKRLQTWVVYEGTTLTGGGRPTEKLELIRGGVRAALTRQLFADLLTQRVVHSSASATQFRLRYNFSEGHDLWIVAERGRLTRGAASSGDVTIKYTRQFALGGQGA